MASQNIDAVGGRTDSPPGEIAGRFRRFRKILKVCENPDCKKSRFVWRFWRRSADGIRLQGRWYCGPECFEQIAQAEFKRLCSAPEGGRKKAHRMPIGLLMLSRGMISDRQLKQALSLQKEKGDGRIGKFLQDIGAATEKDVAVGLAAQWGCPVYPLDESPDSLQYASLLPMTLLETGRMLPVHLLRVPQTLYLAFVEGIDRNALYAVEQMLGLRTIPCIVSESAYVAAIEELINIGDTQTTVFESRFEPREMARTTRSYALRVGASDVWMVRSGRFVWVRLQTLEGPKDILFRASTVF
jgi:hypothetical protein